MDSNLRDPRGILNPSQAQKNFDLSLHQPSAGLAYFVEYYWVVEWDVQEPYVSENLPHPSVHLVIEPERAYVYGVITGKFTRRLEGQGRVFGVKFKPAAFYPFYRQPISELTDRTVSLTEIFGEDCRDFEEHMRALETVPECVACMETFLCAQHPQTDEVIPTLIEMVECIRNDRQIKRVDDLLPRFNMNKRSLQRLFNQYVGVHPKWIIQRYRLHDAVDLIAQGQEVAWSKLAQELGYFDQAHFIKDFKALIGKTPAEYERDL